MTLLERVTSFLRGSSRARARTRTVLQMEAVECGAAALASILGYYGRIVPLEEARVNCGVSRDGVTAKNVVRAARNYGMEAKGFKKDLQDLMTLPLPAILFWNFNHFLVLEGVEPDRSRVYLNDPAMGPRTVTWDELDEGYTGVVLTFTPGPDFAKGGREPSTLAALKRRIGGSELALLFAAIAGLGLVIPGLVLPALTRIFIDRYLVQGLQSWVQPILIGLALTGLVRAVLSGLRERYLLRLETKLAVSGAAQFFWHIVRLPVEFYSQRYAGDVAERVDLNDSLAALLSGRLASTAIDLVMIVFFGVLMLLYSPLLTLVAVLAVAANLASLQLVSRARVDGNRRLLQESGKFSGALMAGLQNIETVKATSRESDLFSSLAGHMAKVVNADQELSVTTQRYGAVPGLVDAFANVTVLALGGYLVMQGEMTMGMLVAFQTLMGSFMGPVSSLIGLGSQLQDLQGEMARLDDVLRYPADPQVDTRLAAEDGPGEESLEKLSGRIELRDLVFGYSRLADPLVTGFNLTLEPGARVALVGSSGCGKSTISKMICGLFRPWDGEILFDGVPAEEVSRAVRNASIAFVDQDLVLFEGTIRQNLTLWDETIPDEDVIRAAKDALIHDAIASRPGGYDSRLEEGGANFSGGQRQRLDIARALVGNPRILVLDEATSALDTLSEKIIDENLRARGCTCIIVAHRLSTIRDADEIIVLDRGQVVQRGTHDVLYAQADGLYRRLIEA